MLRDENIERLSKRVALHVNRPRGYQLEDAWNDAAIILIKMRERWSGERAEHLSEERQERMVIAWARLRLIDQYESEFARQKRTTSLDTMRDSQVGLHSDHPAEPLAPVSPLSDLDKEEIARLVELLPDRQRQVVTMLMFDGLTQREVAVKLGVSQPAVSANFYRAAETLRSMLKDYEEVIA